MSAIKILVTGTSGQVVSSLQASSKAPGRRANAGSSGTSERTIVIAPVGRPIFDLSQPAGFSSLLAEYTPDVVVNAAAYTAVDKAESEQDAAFAANATGAGALAQACDLRKIPIIHISTDYVFDGKKLSPYVETDAVGPTSVYGRSKLDGERLVAAATPRHVILRTAWVHSPYGNNFVKTMLRLAETRAELGVVDDQWGTPSYAPHLADVILAIAETLVDSRHDGVDRWGIYHAAGTGESTTWCGFARHVFTEAAALGMPNAKVNPIPTSAYPTPATRPANSRLDTTKLETAFGTRMPDWRLGVAACVAELAQNRSAESATHNEKSATGRTSPGAV